MADPWHFPRPDLARKYLAFFDSGISNALLLFAKRRAGKTEFLLRDFAPAAEAGNFRVVYASFWQSPLAPAAVLLYHLEKALVPKTLAEHLRQFLTAPVTRLKLSGELPGAKGEAEVDLAGIHGTPLSDLLLYLDDLFSRLVRSRRRLLLLLDEVQELDTDKTNRALVAALRTSLDKYRDKVAVIFTGSSQDGLTRMFSSREAPFFHFATRIDLPALDDTFVGHIVHTFNRASKAQIDESVALKAFDTVGRNPYYFRKLIEIVLAGQVKHLTEAIAQLRERLPEEQGYMKIWIGLRVLDREVLGLLASGQQSVFSKENRERLSRAPNGTIQESAAVQSVIRRLVSARILVKTDGHGKYEFDDPEFVEWIRNAVNQARTKRKR